MSYPAACRPPLLPTLPRSMLCRYAALTLLPMADSVSIVFISPTITAILAILVLSEPAGLHTLAGCVLSLLGVAVVAQPPMLLGGWAGEGVPWTRARGLGVAFALAGAAMGSASQVTIRRIGLRERPLTVSMWFHATSLASAVAPLAVAFPAGPVLPSLLEAAAMAGVAATSFLGQILMGRGIQLMHVGKAASLSLLQVVVGGEYRLSMVTIWCAVIGNGASVPCKWLDLSHCPYNFQSISRHALVPHKLPNGAHSRWCTPMWLERCSSASPPLLSS